MNDFEEKIFVIVMLNVARVRNKIKLDRRKVKLTVLVFESKFWVKARIRKVVLRF